MIGHKKETLKSDQELAIRALKNEAKKRMDTEVTLQLAPNIDSPLSGEIERAVQEVQGQVRALRSALEARYGRRGNYVTLWLLRYAAQLITMLQ